MIPELPGPGVSARPPVKDAAATELLAEGIAHQLAGRLRDAAECFALAMDAATAAGDAAPLAEGLRRLGIVHHLQGETATGIHYCELSRELAANASAARLAAEAAMALGNMACERGEMANARDLFGQALTYAAADPDLSARIALNLGVLCSMQGNLGVALGHYHHALETYESSHDLLGRARAHHNIGMVRADQKEWTSAWREYDQAASLARQGGDQHLSALCLLNHAEIDMAYQRYDEVQRRAEAAISIFDRVGARVDMADAFRMLGTALRHLNRHALAESRLRSALEIAATAGVPLSEAETCRDIADLCAETGRASEALKFIDRALVLFQQVGATLDVAALTERKTALQVA